MKSAPILTVSALNRTISQLFQEALAPLWVEGEISTFTQATSGHCYFTLKDDKAAVRAVMFRGAFSRVDFRPEVGDKVEVLAQPSFYQPRGDFQLQVSTMRRAGAGDLNLAFLRLKERLQSEGLFDPERKKAIPQLPESVAIVTSLQAAALQDVLTTLRRRAPAIRISIYPTLVQGNTAAQNIIAALQEVQQHKADDLVLLVRGGGSIEDLWCFNDERLARFIADFPLPIVSGVGHETDFTISDFVADMRAPTPTAAAEIVSARHFALREALAPLQSTLHRNTIAHINSLQMTVDHLLARLVSPQQMLRHARLRHQQLMADLTYRYQARLERQRQALTQLTSQLDPAAYVERRRTFMSQLSARLVLPKQQLRQGRMQHDYQQEQLQKSFTGYIRSLSDRLARLNEALAHLGPQEVLRRGYAIVLDGDGRLVKQAAELGANQEITMRFSDGERRAVTTSD